MPDLVSLLTNASMGLAAHRAASATASHNIQNANTPGYARQRAELSSMGAEFIAPNSWIGLGVQLGTVTQARDRFIEAQLPAAFANQARSSAEADALVAVHALDPDATGGLTEALGEFYSATRALSQNPGDSGLRNNFVVASRALASAFVRTGEGVEGARDALDVQLQDGIDALNGYVTNLADLNRAIAEQRSLGAPPNDLLDRRQKVVDELAKLTGGTFVPDSDGNISLVVNGGMALVSGLAIGQITTIPDPANGGHLSLQYTPPDRSSTTTIGTSRMGGRLGGLIAARDGALGGAAVALDTMAWDFATRINALHTTGYALDASTGHRVFAPPPAITTGYARMMAIDGNFSATTVAVSGSAVGVPAGNQIAKDIIDTERQPLSGGLDPGASLARIVSGFGAATSRAKASSEQEGAILERLQEVRDSVSGVSIDEEMINLTKSQRAYEALLKVISTADKMLETLMQVR